MLDTLLSIHQLEHKRTGKSNKTAFDAQACDGCGNYVKCNRGENGSWLVEDIAARAYGRDSKEQLKQWIPPVYSSDQLTELAPITSDSVLLKYKEAVQAKSLGERY